MVSPYSDLPTQEGFLQWIRVVMGVPPTYLPDDWPSIGWAYQISLSLVNRLFMAVGSLGANMYTIMVYNLGGDQLVAYSPDVTTDDAGNPIFYKNVGTDPPTPVGYFEWQRINYGINAPLYGIVESSADQGTSQSLKVPDFVSDLTLGDLMNMKTPWGRRYLSLAQAMGTAWGIT